MYKIDSFDGMLEYLDRIGRQYDFITRPGFPGWIISAQHGICSIFARIDMALSGGYPMYINYNREHKNILAMATRDYNRELGYAMINPFVPSTTRCNTLTGILPHGSGIDANWSFEILSDGRVKAWNSYHAMQEGFYWGWLDFYAILSIDRQFGTVKLDAVHFSTNYIPDWLGGRQMMLDYLYDTIDYSLESSQP